MNLNNLNKGERFIYDWQYHMSGGFFGALADLLSRADDRNLSKLSEGFPDEVDAYIRYSREAGWWESVKQKANKEV